MSETRKGEAIILTHALGWSFFPILTLLTVSSLSPFLGAGITTLVGCITLGVAVTIQGKWSEFKIKEAWGYILAASLLIGVAFYGLLFVGLTKTTAGDASIVVLMEIFFTMIILGLWGKERLSRRQIVGSFLMALGAFIVLVRGSFQINQGNLIILLASCLPSFGNYFMQRARKLVSSTFIMFFRTLVAGILLVMIGLVIDGPPQISELQDSALFLVINGAISFGIWKILWVEAIHRIPITKALSLNSVAPAMTLIFAYFILGDVPTMRQLIGIGPMFLGVFLLVNKRS